MLHNQSLQGPWTLQNPVIIAHIPSVDSNVKTDDLYTNTQSVLDKC